MWFKLVFVTFLLVFAGTAFGQNSFEIKNESYFASGLSSYQGQEDKSPLLANIEFSNYIGFNKKGSQEIYEQFAFGLNIAYDIKIQDTPYSIFSIQPAMKFNIFNRAIALDLILGSGVSYLYSEDGTHPAVGTHAGFRLFYKYLGIEGKLKTFSSTKGVFDIGNFGLVYKF